MGAKATETLMAALFGMAVTSGAVKVMDNGPGYERPSPSRPAEMQAPPVSLPRRNQD
ncbi:hypothetical protein ACFSM5_06290 [Lacibacterium aquatile]|uniref:Uncharacterized protein n=1 Tax=Lacibacterium aquatile TaxID=1168082 RepID=A0ABW5DSG0_9PROT